MKRGFGSKLALTAAISLVASLQTACAQVAPPNGGASSTSGANGAQHAGAGTQQRFWYDGENRRELQVDPDWIVDFRATRPNLERRATQNAEKEATLAPGQSVVLRDETGAPRALPGGVIVRLHESDVGKAQKLFAELGVVPVRALDPQQRTWLVEAPAGLESLALANRLHDSGRFESAAPNWWRPRALK
ncbi:MAG: hypothetical protein LT106_01000 [Burkholderiaceae bacterium]|nr:hypothetical protein [Burkholderiaceae bacterium]